MENIFCKKVKYFSSFYVFVVSKKFLDKMKRLYVVLALFCAISLSAVHSQELQKGGSLLNLGLGFVPGAGLNLSYDYGLIDSWGPGMFTIGGFVGVQSQKHTMLHGDDFFKNHTAFAFRASYRYSITNSFEVYGSAMSGFKMISYTNHWDNDPLYFFIASIAGIRYTFGKSISVFAETGYSLSYVNGGLSFAF